MKQEIIGQGTIVVLIIAIVMAIVGGVIGYVLAPTAEEPDIPPKPGEGIRVDVIGHGDPSDPVWAAIEKGARDAEELTGMTVVTTFTSGDIPAEATAIETAVAAGTDGIAVCVTSPEAMADPIADARAAGVPVVGFILKPPESVPVDGYYGNPTNTYVGRSKISHLDDYVNLKDGDKILFTIEMMGAQYAVQQVTGYTNWLEEEGLDVEVVQLEVTNELSTAETRVVAELSAHPGEYVGIMGGGGIATGASAAAEAEMGLAAGEVPISGIDFLSPTIDGIRDGTVIGVISWQPWSEGFWPCMMLFQLIKWDMEPSPFARCPLTWVTADEIDAYLTHIDEHRW